jgi:DNA polymerase III alpha subunit
VLRAGIHLVRGADIGAHAGRQVAMIGWLVTGKLVTTKNDEPMEFVSFEDTTAIYETTFFPRVYERFCRMLSTARPYLLLGRVEEDFGAVTLTVEAVEFLDASRGAARVARGVARSGRSGSPPGRRAGSSLPGETPGRVDI